MVRYAEHDTTRIHMIKKTSAVRSRKSSQLIFESLASSQFFFALTCTRFQWQQRELLILRERRLKLTHGMYLIRGSVGAYAFFLPIHRRIKKNHQLFFASLLFTGVRSNQDLIWCEKIEVYMGFNVYGGSWLLWLPVNIYYCRSMMLGPRVLRTAFIRLLEG